MDDTDEFIGATSEYEKSSHLRIRTTGSESKSDAVEKIGRHTQYVVKEGLYTPTGNTIKSLPSGIFDLGYDPNIGTFALEKAPKAGLLLELPEMRSQHVIDIVEIFWRSEDDYKKGNEFVNGGAMYKAGILLFGPPGSGKSCTIEIVAKKLVGRGGTVFFSSLNPYYSSQFLTAFRMIEPNRKCIVILEDIDSQIDNFGETYFLEMLDSSHTIDNVMFIATTNYPERLDPRIYNRPGRLSHVLRVGLPGSDARTAFLKAILKNHSDVSEIVAKTDGFSVDHLSSLINGVYREKKQIGEEIERLRKLFRVPKSDDSKPVGFS